MGTHHCYIEVDLDNYNLGAGGTKFARRFLDSVVSTLGIDSLRIDGDLLLEMEGETNLQGIGDVRTKVVLPRECGTGIHLSVESGAFMGGLDVYCFPHELYPSITGSKRFPKLADEYSALAEKLKSAARGQVI